MGDFYDEGYVPPFQYWRTSFICLRINFLSSYKFVIFFCKLQIMSKPHKLIETIRRHGKIMTLYNLLLETRWGDLDRHDLKWENQLGEQVESVAQSINIAGKILILANLRAHHYKTTFNLYHTPAKMLKWGGVNDGKCFRCGADTANVVHIFYPCEKLIHHVGHIERYLSQITGAGIMISTSMMLLGIGEDLRHGLSVFKFRYLIFIATAVARLCI